MERFINTNDLLKQTKLPEIFHQGETQQRTEAFLETMHAKYAKDPQFKYVLSQFKPNDVSTSIEMEYKSTRIAGWAAKLFNWIRNHELRQLQEDFQNAKDLVDSF
jgi:hypothetical protein